MRLDRNRRGGGVLMYVLDKDIIKRLPSHASLELLTVTLIMVIIDLVCHCFIVLLVLQLMFCIPFIVILSQLTFLSFLVLYSLVTLISTFLTLLTLLLIIFAISCLLLAQVVDNYTHLYRDSCHSPIDLVLLSNPSLLSSCQTIPPLSNSDHLWNLG